MTGNTNDYIFASYGALIGIALLVVLMYLRYLKKKWIGWASFRDPFFETALGILGIAVSTLLIRVYFQGWKSGEILGFDTVWMLGHPVVIAIILFPCFCYTWHIRTITRREYGEKVWLLSGLFSVVCWFLTYWFAKHHEWALEMKDAVVTDPAFQGALGWLGQLELL